jgi:hypothetical protein
MCHQFWVGEFRSEKEEAVSLARVLYARMTVRCLHHLHHFSKKRRLPSKNWQPLFFTGGRQIITGGHHAKYMNHHIDVVQVVQAPNTHARIKTRAREAITVVVDTRPMPFSILIT